MALYCQVQDVTDSFQRVKSAGLVATEMEALIDKWSAFVDGYLAARYNVPLSETYPPLIVRCVAELVALDILKRVQNPPTWLRDTFESWMAILEQIAKGTLILPGVLQRTDMGRIRVNPKGFEPPFGRVPSLDERYDPNLEAYEKTKRGIV